MDGKLLGSWACARYAAPHMRAGGSITFVTGCAVVRPPRHAAMVVAAFAAVEALSRALALELGPLRVNTIRPGYTDSEMWSGLSDAERDGLRRRVADAVPTGRMGTPEDIAHAALFLMTSRQTTGAVLEVSGGETLVEPVELTVLLVTGATGNVGREVVAALAARGEDVRAVVRDRARRERAGRRRRGAGRPRAPGVADARARRGPRACSCSAAGATCRAWSGGSSGPGWSTWCC